MEVEVLPAPKARDGRPRVDAWRATEDFCGADASGEIGRSKCRTIVTLGTFADGADEESWPLTPCVALQVTFIALACVTSSVVALAQQSWDSCPEGVYAAGSYPIRGSNMLMQVAWSAGCVATSFALVAYILLALAAPQERFVHLAGVYLLNSACAAALWVLSHAMLCTDWRSGMLWESFASLAHAAEAVLFLGLAMEGASRSGVAPAAEAPGEEAASVCGPFREPLSWARLVATSKSLACLSAAGRWLVFWAACSSVEDIFELLEEAQERRTDDLRWDSGSLRVLNAVSAVSLALAVLGYLGYLCLSTLLAGRHLAALRAKPCDDAYYKLYVHCVWVGLALLTAVARDVCVVLQLLGIVHWAFVAVSAMHVSTNATAAVFISGIGSRLAAAAGVLGEDELEPAELTSAPEPSDSWTLGLPSSRAAARVEPVAKAELGSSAFSVTEQLAAARRLVRLEELRLAIIRAARHDLGTLPQLDAALADSTAAYGKALAAYRSQEPEAMRRLEGLEAAPRQAELHGCSLDDTVASLPSVASSESDVPLCRELSGSLKRRGGSSRGPTRLALQPCNDLGRLLLDASRAQGIMKEVLAPGSAWAAREDGSRQSTSAGPCVLEGAQGGWQEGLLPCLDGCVDLGPESREAAEWKADTRYREGRGWVQYERLRDLARLALVFDSAERLLAALPHLARLFDVELIENGFQQPTALGWMEAVLVVRVDLAPGTHVGELRLQLRRFADARAQARGQCEKLVGYDWLALQGVAAEEDRVAVLHLISTALEK